MQAKSQNDKTNRTKKTQERKDTPKLLVNDDDDDDATMTATAKPVSATVADTNYNLNPKLLYLFNISKCEHLYDLRSFFCKYCKINNIIFDVCL